jgi:quinol monooxygenase YgiN
MPIFQTGAYRVKPAAVGRVKQAITDFVQYVKASEPGTEMYLAWQRRDDPIQFIHLFIFADAAAHERHGRSEAVKRFEQVYSPKLVGGGVVFTDYDGRRKAMRRVRAAGPAAGPGDDQGGAITGESRRLSAHTD